MILIRVSMPKESNTRRFRQHLEKGEHDAQDIEVVLNAYLAGSTRYKKLDTYGPLQSSPTSAPDLKADRRPSELGEHLPALEGMLRDLKTLRIQAYRPIRVGIAGRAILKFHYSRRDLVHSQKQALHRFIQTFPYMYWHPNITLFIHEDRRDTPEDRQKLHDAVTRLLTQRPEASAYVLSQAINAVVLRPPLTVPAPPVASQNPHTSVSEHLPVQIRRSAPDGPPPGPSQSS